MGWSWSVPFTLTVVSVVIFRQATVSGQDAVKMKLRCYRCDSETHPGCDSPAQLKSEWHQDCTGFLGEDRCLKIVGPGVLVSRGCEDFEMVVTRARLLSKWQRSKLHL
ncbi:hypothetical protein BV898_15068 [Hypsibius exemplaris]|uniref:Protein quiver n=1 Tax=Hypsibius exemplaris TaxID=2072580 RepID=A0A9X6RK53_HYPEX|nr:hypothetical protein BV898_15068 [Hypsibius exemplaris]